MMTVSIIFAPEDEARLRESATAAGKDVGTFIREAALEKVDRPSPSQLATPTHPATSKATAKIEEINLEGRHVVRVRSDHAVHAPVFGAGRGTLTIICEDDF